MVENLQFSNDNSYSQVVVVKKNNFGKWAKKLLLLIIILLVIYFGYRYIFKNITQSNSLNNSSSYVSGNITPSSKNAIKIITSDSFLGWEQYVDSVNNFSFKYAKDWTVNKDEVNNVVTISPQSGSSKIIFKFFTIGDSNYVKQRLTNASLIDLAAGTKLPDFSSSGSYFKTLYVLPYSLNGYVGYLNKTLGLTSNKQANSNMEVDDLAIKKSNNIYLIEFFYNQNESISSLNQSTFSDFLSTIKF